MGYKLAGRQQDLTPLQREYLIQAYPKLLELQTFGVKSFNEAIGGISKGAGGGQSTKNQLIEKIKERRG